VAAQHKPDYDQRLLEVGDEALWIWSHALTAGDGHGDTPKVYRAQLPAPQPRARKEIIIPAEPTPRRVNHGLILAIARAKTWMQGLCDGRYKNARARARARKPGRRRTSADDGQRSVALLNHADSLISCRSRSCSDFSRRATSTTRGRQESVGRSG
jgi:hypothetical protein